MRSGLRRAFLVGGLAAVGVAWAGCDAALDVTSPGREDRAALLAPDFVGEPLRVLERLVPPTVPGTVPLGRGGKVERVAGRIGPEGGELALNGVRLVVPTGALRTARKITMEVPADGVVRAEFKPHGLRFLEPVELWFSLEGTAVAGDPERAAELVGVYYSAPIKGGMVIPDEIVPLRVDGDQVVLTIWHFSGYTPAGG